MHFAPPPAGFAPDRAMEVLDCVVTPEWAAALAGVSTGHLEVRK